MMTITLFDYWRSSSSYRVRIALWLKGLSFSVKPVDLLRSEQKSKDHLRRQPQGLVPAIEIDGEIFTQSLAIIEYIDQLSSVGKLIPNDPVERAHVQAMSQTIAMEIHPICNLRVVNHVAELMGGDSSKVKRHWMQHFIASGLQELELSLNSGATGSFCHGDQPSMADCCLIPQLYNATRWGVDYTAHEQICQIKKSCLELEAFQNAHPDRYNPS